MAQEQAKLYEQYIRLKDGVSACAQELQRTMAFDYAPYYGGPIAMTMPAGVSEPAMMQNQHPINQQGFNNNNNLNLQQGK
jgi:hypothetical protein